MNIVLVSPRIAVQKGDFLGSGIPYWPVELAVFASFLQQKGHAVSVIDLFGSCPTRLEERQDHYLQGTPFTAFLGSQAVRHADLLVLFAMSSMSHQDLLLTAKCIRSTRSDGVIAVLENTQAVTAYDISQLAEEFFQGGVDLLLCGEMYWNWDEVVAYLENSAEIPPPSNVLMRNHRDVHGLIRRTVKNPSYPVAAWDLFNLENYWSLPYSHGPKTRRFLPVLTSRGCPFSCDFCVAPAMNGRHWRGRSAAEVVDELITLRDRYGVRHFQVEDLNPTVSGQRWVEISRLLLERTAGIFFYFVSGTKAETIRVEHIPRLAKAGCRYISISPETGSSRLVKTMGKRFNYDHALAVIRACREHGIYTQACLLVGHPAERAMDHDLSRRYLRAMVRAGLDEVGIFVIAPLAGSALHAKGRIGLASPEALISFSPKGRQDWGVAEGRRKDLIKVFLVEKVRMGKALWLQGIRALFGVSRTKMENLPRRVAFIHWLILKHRLNRLLRDVSSNGADTARHRSVTGPACSCPRWIIDRSTYPRTSGMDSASPETGTTRETRK